MVTVSTKSDHTGNTWAVGVGVGPCYEYLCLVWMRLRGRMQTIDIILLLYPHTLHEYIKKLITGIVQQYNLLV